MHRRFRVPTICIIGMSTVLCRIMSGALFPSELENVTSFLIQTHSTIFAIVVIGPTSLHGLKRLQLQFRNGIIPEPFFKITLITAIGFLSLAFEFQLITEIGIPSRPTKQCKLPASYSEWPLTTRHLAKHGHQIRQNVIYPKHLSQFRLLDICLSIPLQRCDTARALEILKACPSQHNAIFDGVSTTVSAFYRAQ